MGLPPQARHLFIELEAGNSNTTWPILMNFPPPERTVYMVKEALAALLKVKTIITLLMVCTACYLAVTQQLDVAVFVGLVTSIITYYFTRKDGGQNE